MKGILENHYNIANYKEMVHYLLENYIRMQTSSLGEEFVNQETYCNPYVRTK